MTDKEILDTNIGGITIRDITGLSFYSWVANKLDGAPTYKAATQELLALVRSAPMGTVPEEEKLRVCRKLLEIGITL
jgi:hypothetical protein